MPDTIVSRDWVAENRGDVAVVDVRRAWEYNETPHIPDAVNVPFESFRDPTDETPGKMPTASSFSELLGSCGIGPDDRIVAYDSEFGVYASRFLVTAEVFGHEFDRLHLLDGDIESWAREYQLSERSPEVQITEYTCSWSAGAPVVTASGLEELLATEAVIVDTRNQIEYDTVHLPGAIHFEWQSLVDEKRRTLRPDDELEEILTSHGITMDRPVRLYCNTARRLSFLYVVLQYLDYEDIAFYEGGIDTWAEHGGALETT